MMAALAAVTACATLFVVAGTAGPAAAASGSGCPASKLLGSIPTASNVGAAFSNSGTTSTYTFSSLTNENPVGGVPGLVKYCVYPSPVSQPTAVTVAAKGANGAKWVSAKGSNNFAFVRPGGDKTNIPLDGKTTTMGTATWSALPSSQTIILHINDPTVCASLYGSGTPGTCFVKPRPGPVCDTGSANTTGVVYTSLPRDAVNCAPPSLGFEAHTVSEFGDEVRVSSIGQLKSLTVLFSSYACGDSGHWNTGATDPCKTTPGETFTHPITATIYDATGGVIGAQLAQVTQTPTIPYRPSADATNCPGAGGNGSDDVGSKWFNTVSGKCQYSISTLLTFTFPSGTTLPSQVIWTVAYNTSTAGYAPLGTGNACNALDQGCPYDSLNVGVMTYPGAPYVGTDVDPDGTVINSQSSGDTCGAATGSLVFATPCWSGYTPLGEISTT
jgi:hypothetical protein